ncbi:transmembrane emp24 domain-containing protein 9-like isoform X2 [Centropristis striata]|uniref:transmembrane emp24 domain-containing protein 9-like isoform X1 n=1 Tax=Centropristis striata TaxID=184440 RepID=UPI0027DF8792|nr:transmembrane emp24 domain-containing protein 9-like isoform X1 [Centropristis striata]XP_059202864.1 transmembrane emp24 domain-containing protein 9-like isoform X2 [Centropristis striata]
MASGKLLTVVFLNIFYSFGSSSLFFDIGDSESKCFIEDIPDQTRLIGNYRTQLYDKQRDEYLTPSQSVSLSVKAKDPDDELVLSRSHVSDGRFIFTSQKAGRHVICLQSDSQRPLPAGAMLRVHLEIRVGEQTNNYTSIATVDKLTELQLRVRQLAEQVQQIQKTQEYLRLMEKDFRQVNLNIYMWIFWWPVVRSLYTVLVIIWFTKSW